MTSPLTDAAYAERMLRSALGGEPQLSDEQIADLMLRATSLGPGAVSQYTERDLNRAASLGWQWKASLTADQYDLGGGPGKTLDRSQWFAHCMAMTVGYADGTFSVLGSPNVATGTPGRGIGVIQMQGLE